MATNAQTQELLFEIGCEELPASFVEAALAALPTLAAKRLGELRLTHGSIETLGTPRRLALLVHELAAVQPDLEQEMVGPPIQAAFRDDKPTRAAEAFAAKLGCSVAELRRVETPKGVYVAGTKREAGRPALELLPAALVDIAKAIPFRKAMRWGTGSFTFGRPIRWVVALLGAELVELELAGVRSGRSSFGHRFLHPEPVLIAAPERYVAALREAHVLVVPHERAALMRQRLIEAGARAGGSWIEDPFLLGENLSLCEEPHVVVGSFEPEFLELPEAVVLEVARGHQRYFCVRGADGRLLPKYLAVVNTAEKPEVIQLGNDRVMRARLSDARFFCREDLARPLAERRAELGRVVFQERLGTVLAKTERAEALVRRLGTALGLPARSIELAAEGTRLGKCDLVTRMVGEFPELQGQVGRAYAERQGMAPELAAVLSDHYLPRGASDPTAPTDAGALAAIADRLDTVAGCFGVGLAPTGANDPYGLRRACIGTLRTLLDRGFNLSLCAAFDATIDGFVEAKVALELDRAALGAKLAAFFRDRLRGLLCDGIDADVVDAVLGVAADRPLDARARARAILALDPKIRASVGELFKRATNIAKSAPEGEPVAPSGVVATVLPSEQALHDGYLALRERLGALHAKGEYGAAFEALAAFTPLLARYFDEVFVMDEDPAVRDNRLRLMRAISESCTTLAQLQLLGSAPTE